MDLGMSMVGRTQIVEWKNVEIMDKIISID